jgi:hypothetical protein
MTLNCPCCGRKYETSGTICFDCTTITICKCGTQWCNRHQQELYLEHEKICPGWGHIIQRSS